MRKPKFRAWSNENNRYCDFVTLDESGRWIGWIKSSGVYLTTVDIILEQCTGLKDKNGKDIYEGDVVKVNDDFDKYGLNAGEIYEVYFNAGGFRCKPKYESSITRGDKGFWIDDGNDYEVIGNVHQNDDLLEDK